MTKGLRQLLENLSQTIAKAAPAAIPPVAAIRQIQSPQVKQVAYRIKPQAEQIVRRVQTPVIQGLGGVQQWMGVSPERAAAIPKMPSIPRTVEVGKIGLGTAFNILSIPSYAIGGLLKAGVRPRRPTDVGPPQPLKLARAAWTGIREKTPVFEELPTRLGVKQPLARTAVGLAGELVTPEISDILRVTPYLFAGTRIIKGATEEAGEKALKKIPKELEPLAKEVPEVGTRGLDGAQKHFKRTIETSQATTRRLETQLEEMARNAPGRKYLKERVAAENSLIDMAKRDLDKIQNFITKIKEPKIPKELEPLAQEARKFKSVEEFVSYISSLKNKYQAPLNQRSTKTLAKSNREMVEAGTKLQELGLSLSPFEMDKPIGFSSLTDFYNQAVSGVKEAATQIKVPKEAPDLTGRVKEIKKIRAAAVKELGSFTEGIQGRNWKETYKFKQQFLGDLRKSDSVTAQEIDKLEMIISDADDMLAKLGRNARGQLITKKGEVVKEIPSITSKVTKAEVPVEKMPKIKVKAPEIPEILPSGKERKFIKTVREAPTTAPEVAQAVKGTYIPKPNRVLMEEARGVVEANYDDALRLVREGPKSAYELDKVNAVGQEIMRRAQNEKRFDEAVEVAETLATYGTEYGRGVQAFSIWSRLTPEGMLRYAAREIKKARETMGPATKAVRKVLGKAEPELTPKSAERITALMKQADKATDEVQKAKYVQLAMFEISEKIPWGVSDVIDAYRYNNMLSGPLTHLRNAWSNLINTYITRPGTLLASGQPIEAAKYEVSALSAFPEAIDSFVRSFKGEAVVDLTKKIDIPKFRGTQLPVALSWPTRAMEAADAFFSTLIQAGERARGATPEEAFKTAEYFLYRGGAEGQGYLLNELDKIPRIMYSARRVRGIGWLIPFIRTPFNFAKAWVEYSPMGVATIPGAADKRAQAGKALLGSLATLVGLKAAMEGRTTWSAPTSEKEKQYFYAAGKKPFSVKIGDNWVPMAYFTSFAWAVALPAAWQYYQTQSKTALTDSDLNKAFKVVGSLTNFWSQSTPMQGLGSFVRLLEGDVDISTERIAARTVGQLKPFGSLMRYIATAIDPIYRRPRTFGEEMVADVPFLSQTIRPYREPTGKPSERLPINLILPYAIGEEKPQMAKIFSILEKTGQWRAVKNKLQQLKESVGKGDITPEEYTKQVRELLQRVTSRVGPLPSLGLTETAPTAQPLYRVKGKKVKVPALKTTRLKLKKFIKPTKKKKVVYRIIGKQSMIPKTTLPKL